eukprot:4881893-Heterocapsa_arctica.AAC.1
MYNKVIAFGQRFGQHLITAAGTLSSARHVGGRSEERDNNLSSQHEGLPPISSHLSVSPIGKESDRAAPIVFQ